MTREQMIDEAIRRKLSYRSVMELALERPQYINWEIIRAEFRRIRERQGAAA